MSDTAASGMSLGLIAQKTRMPQGTLRSLLSRNLALQKPPYSTKAGGARVFFPPFISWLAEHQGEVAKVALAATSATRKPPLPSGSQLRELRLMAEKDRLSRSDLRTLLGLAPEVIALPAPEEGKAPPALAEAAFEQIGELFDEGAKP